jgi:Predicted transcriptional regulators
MGMLRIDNTKRYTQLAVELLKKIFNGYYELGSKLPSTRELAKQAGVNPNTMQRALQVLQDEKVLIKQSTTGRYITTDIQLLSNMRNEILVQIRKNYQETVKSYGNSFEKYKAVKEK